MWPMGFVDLHVITLVHAQVLGYLKSALRCLPWQGMSMCVRPCIGPRAPEQSQELPKPPAVVSGAPDPMWKVQDQRQNQQEREKGVTAGCTNGITRTQWYWHSPPILNQHHQVHQEQKPLLPPTCWPDILSSRTKLSILIWRCWYLCIATPSMYHNQDHLPVEYHKAYGTNTTGGIWRFVLWWASVWDVGFSPCSKSWG